ncbi:MAG: lipoprotein [Thermoguttaceae bacterium]
MINIRLNFFINLVVILSLLFVVAGCGNRGPAVYHVTGTVYLDDEPLPECRVIFTPKNPGGAELDASGSTDANGVYKIQTLHGKPDGGTTPGDYTVSFSKMNIIWDGKSYVASSTPGEEPIKDTRSEEGLPVEYTSQRTSPESATVTKDAKKKCIRFSLAVKIKSPYTDLHFES